MPIHLQIVFFMAVSSVSYALSVYTLGRLLLLSERLGLDFLISFLQIMTQPMGLICSALMILIYFLVAKVISVRWARPIGWLSGGWMGYLALTLFYAGPLHLIELTLSYLNLSLDFIVNSLSQVSLIAVHLGLVYGIWNAARPPLLKTVDIKDRRIGQDLHQFKILQLSDIHIGPTLGRGFVKKLHTLCQSVQANLIVMTGDLVDGEVRFLGDEVKEFLSLEQYAEHGLLLITGNHEYISGAQDWVDFINQVGGQILENEHRNIQVGKDTLSVIGVEDWDAHKFDPQRTPSLEQAMQELPSNSYKLLLAHQPKAAPQAADLGIDLQLSGHTHAGQIFPFNFLIYLDQPYNVGLYHLKKMKLYVNPGTGYWGPPVRIGTRAEATLLTLHHDP